VTPSLEEPFPGWVDNYSALNGITAGILRGTYRTMNLRNAKLAEMVPVDLVVNTLLVAAADLQNTRSSLHRSETSQT